MRRLAFVALAIAPLLTAASLVPAAEQGPVAAEPAAEWALEPLPFQAWREPMGTLSLPGGAMAVQADFQRISSGVTEAAWEIRLANPGDQPIRAVLRQDFGGEWLVVDENWRHRRKDGAAIWSLTVPPKGEVLLKVRARVKGA